MKPIVKKLSLYATIGTLGMLSSVGCGPSEDTNKEEVITEGYAIIDIDTISSDESISFGFKMKFL